MDLNLLPKKQITLTFKPNMGGDFWRVPFVNKYTSKVDTTHFGIRYLGNVKQVNGNAVTIVSPVFARWSKTMASMVAEVSFMYLSHFYYFNAHFLRIGDNGECIIAMPKTIEKKQGREVKRIISTIPISVKKIDDKALGQSSNSYPQLIKAKDISSTGMKIVYNRENFQTTGMRVVTDKKTAKNSTLELEFKLRGTQQILSATGEVKWVNRVEKTFEHGIQFTRMSDGDRYFLLRFIYNRLKQKGGSKHKKHSNSIYMG